MKTVFRLADVFSIQSWVAKTAWPWFKRAYFLQGFLFPLIAFPVIGNGLLYLLINGQDSALAGIWFVWLCLGVIVGLGMGFAWDDTNTRADRWNALDARLRARFTGHPDVIGFLTSPRYGIRLWVRPGVDVSQLPTEIDGVRVELVIHR